MSETKFLCRLCNNVFCGGQEEAEEHLLSHLADCIILEYDE